MTDVDTGTVFCGSLSARTAAWLAWMRLRGRIPDRRAALLDGPPVGVVQRLAESALKLVGIEVSEARFFAGHLRTADGEAVRPAARKAAFRLALDAAADLVSRSATLRCLDGTWPRHVVRLYLARRLWASAERLMLRVMVAEAIARASSQRPAAIVLPKPSELPAASLWGLQSDRRVHFVGRTPVSARTSRAGLMAWWVRQWWRGRKERPSPAAGSLPPSVLVPQEDELSLDRSHRTQPHWLARSGNRPLFRTLVLCATHEAQRDAPAADLASLGIVPLGVTAAAIHGLNALEKPIRVRLQRDVRRSLVSGLLSGRRERAIALAETARLFGVALGLAALCRRENVKAFMTCENYMLAADAMQLVAPALGVRTISYQVLEPGLSERGPAHHR